LNKLPAPRHARRPRRLVFADAPALARRMHKLRSVIAPASPEWVGLGAYHGGEWLLSEPDTGMSHGLVGDDLVEQLIEMEWVYDASDEADEEVVWRLSARGRRMCMRLRPVPTTSNDRRLEAQEATQ